MLNKFIVQGRMSRDPKLLNNEKAKILLFNVACNSSNKKDKVDFIDAKAFGPTAEFISKYIPKGRAAIFEGYIASSSYEKNGNKVFTQDLIVTNVYFNENKELINKQKEPDGKQDLDQLLFD